MIRSRTGAAGIAALLVAGLVTASAGHPAAAASVVYEAEDATIVNGVVESNHAGFTGRGFVNSDNAVGAAVEWTVSPTAAGNKSLVFRYANGTTTSRPATITINGSTVTTLQFPGTGSWTNWMIQTVSAPLNAGANTVRATATTANGLANLDSLTD